MSAIASISGILRAPGFCRPLAYTSVVSIVIGAALILSILNTAMADESQWADSAQSSRWLMRPYGGIAVARARMEPNTEEVPGFYTWAPWDTGYQLFAGVDIRQGLSLEAHYNDSGSARLTDGSEVGFSSAGVSAVLRFGSHQGRWQRRGLHLYGRIGFGLLDNDLDDTRRVDENSNSHVLFGAGLEYRFGNGIGIRVDGTRYDQDYQAFHLAALYRFGRRLTPAIDGSTQTAAAAGPGPGKTAPVLDVEPELIASDEASIEQTDTTEVAELDVIAPGEEQSASSSIDAANISGCAHNDPLQQRLCEALGTDLATIYFDYKSESLNDEARASLAGWLAVLATGDAPRLVLSAYTDNIGSRQYNDALARRRAQAVIDHLQSHGVNVSAAEIVVGGETDPVASNDTEAGRANNRRVTLSLQGDGRSG